MAAIKICYEKIGGGRGASLKSCQGFVSTVVLSRSFRIFLSDNVFPESYQRKTFSLQLGRTRRRGGGLTPPCTKLSRNTGSCIFMINVRAFVCVFVLCIDAGRTLRSLFWIRRKNQPNRKTFLPLTCLFPPHVAFVGGGGGESDPTLRAGWQINANSERAATPLS